MPYAIDLDAYFRRIHFSGTAGADRETLFKIHRLHLAAIPFENIDVLLGRKISLELSDIQQKLVHENRGGYCFEQNKLLTAVLEQLGFAVTTMISRVRWQAPEDVQTAQTHMVLMVKVGGIDYLADVGFGGVGLIEPIRFGSEERQHDSYEPRRLLKGPGIFRHQILLKDDWQDVYHINETPAAPVEYEMANWFTSAYPESGFKKRLIVSKADNGIRTTLLNRELTIRDQDGQVRTRTLNTPSEINSTLNEHFRITLPIVTALSCDGIVWEQKAQLVEAGRV